MCLLPEWFTSYILSVCPSQWPRGLRPAAARLLRSWVRISPGAWMFVCCECCVLSGRGLCDELITLPEESYRLWCVVCDLETSRMRRPWPALGRRATKKKNLGLDIVWASSANRERRRPKVWSDLIILNLFIFDSFNSSVNSSDSIPSNIQTVSEWWIGGNVEGNSPAILR